MPSGRNYSFASDGESYEEMQDGVCDSEMTNKAASKDNSMSPLQDTAPSVGLVQDTSNTTLTNTGSADLSKRQQKKLLKKQKWLATKDERKRKEKEKLKLKKMAKLKAGEDLGPSRKLLKLCTMASSACKQRLVIDMAFDDYMNEKDQCKAIKQIHRCYSSNRRAPNPLQFYVTSFVGPSAKIMEKNNGFRNWDVNFREEKYFDVFPREDIVYLSSESENVIDDLDVNKVYVIGGLVDHNNHKGLCHQFAIDNKVAHARLPIDQYLEMKTRKVLTIDHVFQILLAVTQFQTWKQAFLNIIPARKGATELSTNDVSNYSEDNKEIFERSKENEIELN